MKRLKKNKRVRTRDWAQEHEFSFTHDRIKHLRGESVPDSIIERGFVPSTETPNATVLAHTGQWAFVQYQGHELRCLVDDAITELGATLMAPGDGVYVEADGEDWFVRGIAARRSKLSRLAIEGSRVEEQLIAANIDLLVIVASAIQPRFKPGLVDRYLVVAQVCGVEPLLCLNKMDLVDEEPENLALYRELGLPVHVISCIDNRGLDGLRAALEGKLSVFAGHSGVGKSSIISALDPAIQLETREISPSNEKGRHTTTASRLHELTGGIRIIDTPGIRKLGLWGIAREELAYYYPEFEELAAQCRFRNCTHSHEPGCAVTEAIANGTLSAARHQSYLRIRESL